MIINNEIDQNIINYCTNSEGRLIPQRCCVEILKRRNWYNYLLNRYDDNVSITEKTAVSESLYRLLNNINKAPKCKICGNPVNYTPARGYAVFCSKKCSNNDTEVLQKNSKNVSKALLNAYKTRGDEIKEKRKKSLKAYNASTCSPFSSEEIKNKAKESVKFKYGVENVMYLPEFHKTAKPVARYRSTILWKNRGYDIEYLDENNIIIKNGCKIHGDITLNSRNFCNRMKEERRNSSLICPICHPINTYSGEEKSMSEFLDTLNIHYIKNDRSEIKPLELDFFFPDYNIAIELNGLWFHSELFKKDKNYHLNKMKLCADKGIRLIYIWEDEWLYNTDIVKSMICNIFNKSENRIYARDCEIRELIAKEYTAFVNENHLQKSVNSKYKFGLIHNGEIVAVMGFGSVRISLGSKNKKDVCELYRYCCKKNTVIPGAASKLFKYASNVLKKDGFKQIITYAKCDFSDGGIYKTLGFEYIGNTVPGYFWTNGRDRINRFSARKSEITETEEDKAKSEIEIMHSRHFYRCYDTGNMKFIYVL